MIAECIPEWCDPEIEGHDDTCPNAPYPLTKGEFVEAARISARNAITAFLIMREEPTAVSHDEAIETAVDEAEETTTCYVGIGSCGRGWCKHG